MAKVSFRVKRGPNKGKLVTFNASSGKKKSAKKTAYQTFIAKKVRSAVKGVPKAKRMAKAKSALSAAAKEWTAKKRKRRTRR